MNWKERSIYIAVIMVFALVLISIYLKDDNARIEMLKKTIAELTVENLQKQDEIDDLMLEITVMDDSIIVLNKRVVIVKEETEKQINQIRHEAERFKKLPDTTRDSLIRDYIRKNAEPVSDNR